MRLEDGPQRAEDIINRLSAPWWTAEARAARLMEQLAELHVSGPVRAALRPIILRLAASVSRSA